MVNANEQLSFGDEQSEADNGPVVCLGMTFDNEDERREYFRNELRKKLPELRNIEGFPIGEDEDIIALSDPPYYTVCPNPWINNFIGEWKHEQGEKSKLTIHLQLMLVKVKMIQFMSHIVIIQKFHIERL